MKIPTIHGIIERRMLVNYTAEPNVVEKILPKPFKPKLFDGKAIVGICLIRLKNIKPKGFPDFIGVNSENGAHRIAVEWEENGEIKEGVFIPRRDTSLKLNAIVGGRVFPGKHYFAKFNVTEQNNKYHLDFKSSDNTTIEIDAELSEKFDENSIFKTIENVSSFFENGSVGYSPNGKKFDGLKLETYEWNVKPLKVSNVKSSFFEDKNIFPERSLLVAVTIFSVYSIIDQGVTLTYQKEGYTDTENDLNQLIEIINKTDLTKNQIKTKLKDHRLFEYMDFKSDTVSLDRVLLIFENDKLKNVTKQW